MNIATKLYGLLCTLPLFGGINEQGDSQLWLTNHVQGNLTSSISARAATSYWFADNMSTLYYQYNQLLFRYAPSPFVALDIGYRQGWLLLERTSSTWFREIGSITDLYLTYPKERMRMQYRARVQRRFFKKFRQNIWRLRNRARLLFPIANTPLNIGLWDEVFYDSDKGFDENRLGVDLQADLHKHIRLKSGAIHRKIFRDSQWKDTFIFTMDIAFRF